MKIKGREKINELLIYLKKSNDYKDKNELIEYIKNNELPFDDDTFYDVIKIIIDNNYSFAYSLTKAKTLYEIIDEYDIFLKVLTNILASSNINVIDLKEKYSVMYNLFENKNLFLQIIKIINKLIEERNIEMNRFDKLYKYMVSSRRYYIDENAYFASLIETFDLLKDTIFKESLIDKRLEEDRKIAGVYNVDDKYLEELPDKIISIKNQYKELKRDVETNVDIINQQMEEILNKSLDLLLVDEKITTKKQIEENVYDILKKQVKENVYDTIISNDFHNILQIVSNISNNTEYSYSYSDEIKDKIINLIKTERDKLKSYEDKLPENIYNLIARYYWALLNDNEEIYNLLINKDIRNERLFYQLLSRSLTFEIGLEEYKSLIQDYFKVLDDIWDVSVETEIEHDGHDNLGFKNRLMLSLEVFGKENLLKADYILYRNLTYLDNYDQFKYYKKLYDVNSDFKIYKKSLIYENGIFTVEEMANFEEKQQIIIDKLLKYNREFVNDENKKCQWAVAHKIDNQEVLQCKESFRKCYFFANESTKNINLNFALPLMLECYKFDIEKFVFLDLEKQEEMLLTFFNNRHKEESLSEIKENVNKFKAKKLVSKIKVVKRPAPPGRS